MTGATTPTHSRLLGRPIETVGLFVLLTVVGLRPLISESYDLAGLAMTAALVGITDPLPLHTLLLDVAILFGALAWAVGHALQRQRYRWCGLESGFVLIAVAATASCTMAGDKRLAVNASVDWVAMALLGVVLPQMLRERRDVRLALCVIVASAAVQAYQCFDQVFVTFPETEHLYAERQEAFWQTQGVPLDSAQVALFEARMRSREASGYLAHSNVAAAHLLLGGFAALGLAAGRWRRNATGLEHLSAATWTAVALLILVGMILTHSIGAAAAGVIGAGLAVTRYTVARRWIEAHRVQALTLGWTVFVGGALAVLAHGSHHGSLPGASLNFRWGYWTASARLVADHLWTGVGRENFGDAYLHYKAITTPEEVKNPHNLLVTAAAEWGLPGLAGVLALLVGGSIAVTRPLHAAARREARPPVGGSSAVTRPPGECAQECVRVEPAVAAAGHPRLWMVLLTLSIFGPRLALLGSTDPNYLYIATFIPALVWVAGFFVCALGPDPWEYLGRGGWVRLAVIINCGLLAFLLQDMVNFALLVPGAATPLWALVGVAIAARQVPPPGFTIVGCVTRRAAGFIPAVFSRRWGFALASGAALAAVSAFVVLPVWRATDAVVQARASRAVAIQGPIENHPANRLYLAALAADPLDPTAAAERAAWLWGVSQVVEDPVPVLREAVAAVEEAIARRPRSVAFHRRRALVQLALARQTGDPRQRSAAIRSAERVCELYPASPEAYVDLAALQAWVGQTEKRAEVVKSAVVNYHRALDLDARRPPWEAIRRFKPAQVAEIESQIAEAQAWMAQRSGERHPSGE